MENKKLESKLDNLSRTSTIPKRMIKNPDINCPYYDKCNVRIFGRIKCLFDYTQCSTYQVFEKQNGIKL